MKNSQPSASLTSPQPLSQSARLPALCLFLSFQMREETPVASYGIPRTGLWVHLASVRQDRRVQRARQALPGGSGCGDGAVAGGQGQAPGGREAGQVSPAARSPPPTSSPWTPVPTRGSLWTAMTPAAHLGWTGMPLRAQHPWFLVTPSTWRSSWLSLEFQREKAAGSGGFHLVLLFSYLDRGIQCPHLESVHFCFLLIFSTDGSRSDSIVPWFHGTHRTPVP